jgi:hypothetical protein
MPTNRTPIRRDSKLRITQKALTAYRRVLANADDQDAKVELFFALGRLPWQYDILAANDPPAYITDPSRIADYKAAREIKRELDRLTGD